MKKNIFTISLIFVCLLSKAQDDNNSLIKVMKWGLNYTIRLELSNDSTYVLNIKDLYQTNATDSSIYYPVNLNKDFLKKLKENKTAGTTDEDYANLYRAIHSVVGGGWAHFLNCLMYSLETRQLNLSAPEMIRPVTDWKPDPMTESYKRTKKWKYFIPLNQGLAKKEYKIRKKDKQLNELDGIPADFIKLMSSLSEKRYEKLELTGQMDQVAKVELVKLMLGSNYLGKDQIKFITNSVSKAIQEYSIYALPSVIIFKNFNAAVAMTLADAGYKIEGIVFNDADKLTDDQKNQRIIEINKIIKNINEANQKAIEKKLRKIYTNP